MVLVEELGYFFVIENHVCYFHYIYRNMPIRTPGFEIKDSYLHVKYSFKNVGCTLQNSTSSAYLDFRGLEGLRLKQL